MTKLWSDETSDPIQDIIDTFELDVPSDASQAARVAAVNYFMQTGKKLLVITPLSCPARQPGNPPIVIIDEFAKIEKATDNE